MCRRRGGLALILVVALAGVAAEAQSAKPAQPSVAGKWAMALETPHGKVTGAFELKVDGAKVSGTFATDHSDTVPIAGEYANGRLTFKTEDGNLSFTAKFKDADTLAGALSTERGDLTAVATRVKK
jgi:hypothetical protein